MSQTDDRADITLPVTAEVGSEGGSFSDPTQQVATFEGDLKRHDQPAPGSTAGEANHRREVAAGGVGADPDPSDGMVRYPTEPPDTEGRKTGDSR